MAKSDNNKELINQLSVEGNEYLDKEEYTKALGIFNTILEIDSKNIKAYYNRGRARLAVEQYDEALKDFDKAIELDPNNIIAYIIRGHAYHDLRQYDEALKDYNKVIDLDSTNKEVYNNRANAYYSLRQYDKALEDYNKTIALDSTQKYVYNNKVEALKAQKNGDIEHDKKIDEDIISCYKLAIENNPLDKRYYDFLESFYKKSKQTALADQVESDYYKALQGNANTNKQTTATDLKKQKNRNKIYRAVSLLIVVLVLAEVVKLFSLPLSTHMELLNLIITPFETGISMLLVLIPISISITLFYFQKLSSSEKLLTPYEKKIKELSEQIVLYRKEFETFISSKTNDVNQIGKFNKMLEEFSFLVDTYPENREVLQFAYDVALFLNNKEDTLKYKESVIKLDKDEFELLQNPYVRERDKLSSVYKRKAIKLTLFNILYITGFFVVLGILGFSVYTVMETDFNDTVFTPYVFAIRAMSSITLTMIAFWGARFFNRRIHESVHLSEEYSHRATLLDMFETLKNSVDDKEHQKEILNKIITALTENPTACLNKKKADKIPTELIELAKILKS